MTFRWTLKDLERHKNHVTYEKQEDCTVCDDLCSILIGMQLTNQKYVYVKGQPDY